LVVESTDACIFAHNLHVLLDKELVGVELQMPTIHNNVNVIGQSTNLSTSMLV